MPKILIVDDDFSIRELFKYMFLEAGYNVKLAENGRDALEKITDLNFVPDIMIVDIAMPEMDGSAFIENLKKLSDRKSELKNIPFIVMTGENFISSKYPGFHNNPCCKKYIPKMTNPDHVVAAIKEILKEENKL